MAAIGSSVKQGVGGQHCTVDSVSNSISLPLCVFPPSGPWLINQIFIHRAPSKYGLDTAPSTPTPQNSPRHKRPFMWRWQKRRHVAAFLMSPHHTPPPSPPPCAELLIALAPFLKTAPYEFTDQRQGLENTAKSSLCRASAALYFPQPWKTDGRFFLSFALAPSPDPLPHLHIWRGTCLSLSPIP